MRKRVKELQVLGDKLPDVLSDCVEGAMVEAIKTATQNTPPNTGNLAGTNTRSGQMAEHWQTDSLAKPKHEGNSFTSELNNNMQYASYVNDGHNVNEHFTSHVAIEGGVLVGKPDGDGGLIVGTKTKYVKGLYMKEKAVGKFRSTLRKNLDREVRKLER